MSSGLETEDSLSILAVYMFYLFIYVIASHTSAYTLSSADPLGLCIILKVSHTDLNVAVIGQWKTMHPQSFFPQPFFELAYL